jgi:hypothetical protein
MPCLTDHLRTLNRNRKRDRKPEFSGQAVENGALMNASRSRLSRPGSNFVVLAPDLAAFPNSKAEGKALRAYLKSKSKTRKV